MPLFGILERIHGYAAKSSKGQLALTSAQFPYPLPVNIESWTATAFESALGRLGFLAGRCITVWKTARIHR